MSANLSPDNERFVQAQLATGVYSSRQDAIEAGIELLRKREELVERIRNSREQLDSGQFTDYNPQDLADRFEELKAAAKKAAKNK